ncbi:unnamed protein product [Closterium sp. Naga37s-1]|nr:unnamed protein product [Closterium sp. Naga37s-1]
MFRLFAQNGLTTTCFFLDVQRFKFERASQHQGASAHEAGGVGFNSTTADEKRSRGGAASTPWNHAAASFASVCHALTDSLLVLPAGSFDQYNAKAVMLTKLVVWAPAAEKRSRGEEERRRRGAEEKRNGGEEERRRRGEEEHRSRKEAYLRAHGRLQVSPQPSTVHMSAPLGKHFVFLSHESLAVVLHSLTLASLLWQVRLTALAAAAGDEQWRGEEQRRGAEEGRRVAEETSSGAEEQQSRGAEEKRSTFEHLDWKVLSTSPKAQLERLKSQGRSGEHQGSSSECHGRPNTLQRSFTAGSTVQATPPACTLKVAVMPPPASTLHTSPPPFPWFRLSALSILQSKYLASASAAGRRSKGQEKGAAARVQGAALCSKPALQLGAEATCNGQQKGATGSRKVQRAAERCNGQQ